MIRTVQLIFAASWLALLCAAPASAATCNVSPQSVSFGSYDSLSPSDLDGVGNVNINCDAVVSLTISLGTGGGTYAQRRMTGGASELGYNLYTDASRNAVWGDGNGGSGTVSVSAQQADVAVYGRVPARQNVPAGGYSDVIVVTVTY